MNEEEKAELKARDTLLDELKLTAGGARVTRRTAARQSR
jgi:hypothetical protein